ncbi:DNA repair protein RecO [Halonatronum saccharophilum]|uniref:DNA repair protein RecO n=1 Tax=Halonatronum saccharophilum TaxID=150060 RepID=UPI0004816B47|nr:DNA repair protein RecO [Halonatronum saccharophilum]
MALFDTDAIVLRSYPFKEADKIISLYTKDKGKIKVIAKGVSKTKSSLSAALQPFTYNNILVYKGKSDLGKLSQCDIKESFSKLTSDIYKMSYASYIVEIIDGFTIEYEENSVLFTLLLLNLRLINNLDDLDILLRIFELKLLKLLGYQPYLEGCIECGRELKGSLRFNYQSGGVICSCTNKIGKRISIGSLKYMRLISRLDYKGLLRLKVPQYAKEELEKIIPAYIESLLGKKIKSLAFIKDLNRMDT